MYPPRKAMLSQPQSFEAGPLRILFRPNPLLRLTFFTLYLVNCRTDSKPTVGQTSSQVSLCTYTDRSIPGGKHSTRLHSRLLLLARLGAFQESISHASPSVRETCCGMRCEDLALPNGILLSIAS